MVAEGKPIKAIAAARDVTAAAVAEEVERLFVRLAEGVSSGQDGALRRLRRLHEAIVEREEQGETLQPAAARRRGRDSWSRRAGASARPSGSRSPS